ncbi:MAG: serine/threonine-protein kinase [Myxococcota bacterium]
MEGSVQTPGTIGSAPSASGPDEQTLVVGDGDAGPSVTEDASAGLRVGRYVVLEEVGRGAMGRVLRAYDPKLQREVALKELQFRGRNRARVQADLVTEARAMAKLSHANVVSVFDVEAAPRGDEERLVLAMEFVEGTTLRQWLGEQDRPWRDVVARFVEAGRGLAAAHAAGLLHRDFKPANVMVGRGEAKVTDFGLAIPPRAPTDDGLDAYEVESTVMGTPRYMAPEQHVGRRDLSPAIDQYAFCVSLWEALCGAPPFSGPAISDAKSLTKAKLKGPPAWPRSDLPRWLSAAVVRGLHPEPERRFPSMDALLAVLVTGPGRARARWRVAGAAVVLSSVAGVAVMASRAEPPCQGAKAQLAGVWDDARRQQVEQALKSTDVAWAGSTWERSASTLDGYAEAWTAMHTDACEATNVRREQSDAVLDLRMACLQRARRDLSAAVDVLNSADRSVVERAADLLDGLPRLNRCADIEALQAQVEPPGPADAEVVATTREHLATARAERKAGRYELAKQAVDAAREAVEGTSYGPASTEVAFEAGKVLEGLGEFERAVDELRTVVELSAHHRQLDLLGSASTSLMMTLGYRLKRPDEALGYRALAAGLMRGDAVKEATFHSMVGTVASGQGRFEDAATAYRTALDLERGVDDTPHPRIADFRSNLSLALSGQGKFAEAEREVRAALEILEQTLGPDHPDVATVRNNLAGTLLNQGRTQEAADAYRASLEHRRRVLGENHRLVAQGQGNLATALRGLGQYEEAERLQRASLKSLRDTFGDDDPDITIGLTGLAIILNDQGQIEASADVFEEILNRQQKQHGDEHPAVGQARTNLGMVLRAVEDFDGAQLQQEKALQIFEASLGKEHPLVATALVELARLADKRGDAEPAREFLTRALTIREAALGADHPETMTAREALEVLSKTGRLP